MLLESEHPSLQTQMSEITIDDRNTILSLLEPPEKQEPCDVPDPIQQSCFIECNDPAFLYQTQQSRLL